MKKWKIDRYKNKVYKKSIKLYKINIVEKKIIKNIFL